MQPFIHSVLMYLSGMGYIGIALGLMIEIIPSEIVLAYGGFLISQGHIYFAGALIAGLIGGTIAQWFIYWIGYYGGRPFLKKYGKYLLIHERQIDMAEAWFNKYGSGVIFTARFIPVVRHAISIPAGIAKMSFIKFTLYTMFAVIPWSIFFLYFGMKVGNKWESIREIAAPYVQPVVGVAIVVMVAYFLLSLKKKRSSHHASMRK